MHKEKKTYSCNRVLKSCLNYFDGDELAATTWMEKYAMKSKEGKFLELTPSDMHHRMAGELVKTEKKWPSIKPGSEKFGRLSVYGQQRKPLNEKRIFNYFDHFRYMIPQGSVMASLGNKLTFASLSNCVVLPSLYDSYGGIFYTDQQLAQLFKRRCGVGIDLSALRPAGMYVSNAAGSSSGAVSFMDRFSFTTREVAQKGRRGALMMTLDVSHPDIEAFVNSKQDLRKITGANISVKISDAFMNAVEGDHWFELKFPVNSKNPGYLKKIRARKLWSVMVACAAHTGEPGMLFWDHQHYLSTSSVYPRYKNVSTNPCSEIAMQGGDSCRLLALNLFSFVENPFLPVASFNFTKFYEVVYEAQRLLDDLVELELETIVRILDKVKNDPEPKHIKENERRTWQLLLEQGRAGRRTGLGFTALADSLAALGIRLSDAKAVSMTERIMKVKCEAEFDSSIDMAVERGKFSGFDPSCEHKSGFVLMLKEQFPGIYKRMMKYGRRNVSLSTVSPSGTVSILTRTSSGIEPVFMLRYIRRRKVQAGKDAAGELVTDASGDAWQEFEVQHPKFDLWKKISGLEDASASPYAGSTAHELHWKTRLKLQAIVQRYTTHSISSTLNLPEGTSVEMVGRIYMQAWKMGLKGVTVYLAGSRSGVLVDAVEKKMEPGEKLYGDPGQTTEEFSERLQTVICPVCGVSNHANAEAGCYKCTSCGNILCG